MRERRLRRKSRPPPAESDVRYHPYPYLHDEMVQALAAADLVIARAGASVLGEFPAVGLPSILAPYPYAGQHQDANAAYLADRGAALVVPDGELAGRLAPTVLGLFTEPERLAAMAAATRPWPGQRQQPRSHKSYVNWPV